jgi:hypothetical protein
VHSLYPISGGDGAVPTFGGDPVRDAEVGTALRAFAHPTDADLRTGVKPEPQAA